jgi:adenylate cyclase
LGARADAALSAAAPSFDEHLAREIVRSERTRTAILAGVLAAVAVLFPLFALSHRTYYLETFGSPRAGIIIVSACLVLVGYELFVRAVLGRWQARGRAPSPALRYWNALAETSMPTILIALVSRHIDPLYVLQGPGAFFYGIFIVLSTLRLDFRLSVFTGVVAAVQYLALFAWLVPQSAAAAGTPFATAPFYILKSAILVLTGLAAGFVAAEIRRRVRGIFRSMEESQRLMAAFGQQVSPEIAAMLIEQGATIESRRRFVCVMFMDIRDFTRLVEKRTPEEVVAYQNAVFGAAIEAVGRHRGVINQFLGDGFMATFGAPVATGRDCANALAAAREIVDAVRRLADAGQIPPTRLGFGLHAGEAVCGNIGSEARKQYSITGEVVILAFRIEQLNKTYGSQILASAEVVRQAGEASQAESLGPVTVKGLDQPIELYRLA